MTMTGNKLNEPKTTMQLRHALAAATGCLIETLLTDEKLRDAARHMRVANSLLKLLTDARDGL